MPAWWWPAGLALGGLAAAEVHGGAAGFARSVLPYLVLPALALVALAGLSRRRVRVADGVLHVPGAHVPLAVLGQVAVLDAAEVRRLLGYAASRETFVARPAWLTTGVHIELVDPEDDTRYWLVGSRRPAELAAALAR